MNPITNIYRAPVKTKPLSKLPEILIHQFPKDEILGRVYNSFVLFKPQIPTQKAIMNCFPEYIKREHEEVVPSLFISKILSLPRKCGLGTKMLDFAQKFSKQCGCNGYFHLMADDSYTPNEVPHIFYWKYGMNTKNSGTNYKLEYFAEFKKKASYQDFTHMEMFYPPISFEPKWVNKIKNSISKKFK